MRKRYYDIASPESAYLYSGYLVEDALKTIAWLSKVSVHEFFESIKSYDLIDEEEEGGIHRYVLSIEFKDGSRCEAVISLYDENEQILYIYEGREIMETLDCESA